MVMKTIYSSHKPEVERELKGDVPSIVNYNRVNYKINSIRLRNLGLDYLQEVREYCMERGLDPLPDFNKQCLFCDQNTNSIQAFYSGESQADENGEWIPGLDCKYQTGLELKIASPYEHKETNRKFMAIREDCVFYDGLVKALAENGVLEPYRIEESSFPYVPIQDFETRKANPTDYEFKDSNNNSLLTWLRSLIYSKD